MTPQEFNTLDKVIQSNPVEKLSRQAVDGISQMQRSIPMPSMPSSYTPFMQQSTPEQSYLIALNGQQAGPYTPTQLRQLITEGTATIDTLVWRSGMLEWTPIKNVPGLI